MTLGSPLRNDVFFSVFKEVMTSPLAISMFFLLREDGGYIVRESGGFILREVQ